MAEWQMNVRKEKSPKEKGGAVQQKKGSTPFDRVKDPKS